MSMSRNLDEAIKFLEGEEMTKPKEVKRGHYKKRECPYCHKHFGNLENHIQLKHKSELQEAQSVVTKEDLLGQATPKPERDNSARPEKVTYACNDCKAELKKGENPCWHCGAFMDWSQIK